MKDPKAVLNQLLVFLITAVATIALMTLYSVILSFIFPVGVSYGNSILYYTEDGLNLWNFVYRIIAYLLFTFETAYLLYEKSFLKPEERPCQSYKQLIIAFSLYALPLILIEQIVDGGFGIGTLLLPLSILTLVIPIPIIAYGIPFLINCFIYYYAQNFYGFYYKGEPLFKKGVIPAVQMLELTILINRRGENLF